MLNPIESYRKMWDSPAELLEDWADNSAKIAEEMTVVGILREYPVAANSTYVDIGCGNGRYAEALKTLKPKGYMGYDNSIAMMDAAQGQPKLDYAEFSNVDIFAFSPETKYDVLLCVDVLQYYDKPLQAAERVLELWDANLYMFTLLAGVEMGEVDAGMVVNLAEFAEFADNHNMQIEYIRLIPETRYTWLAVSCECPKAEAVL